MMNDSVVDQTSPSVCVSLNGIESDLWSAASSQSEDDTVTELEGECVERDCFY